MGTYLENYLESVSSLPQDVRRNFALLRDLDNKSEELLEIIENRTKNFLKNHKRKKDFNEEEEKSIKEDLKQCLQLGDEKVALAIQTYELVDKHIRRLDNELKKFEAELGEGIIQPIIETPQKEQKIQEKKPKNNFIKKNKIENTDARVFNVDIDMPIDPNEPTYCICNRVSFGEMVGCDNPECKIEWFHFECVGLTHPPKGKWYCPECTALRKKQLLK